MAADTYLITFRLKRDTTYQDRYARLLEAIADVANGYKTWEEPTSFVALASKYQLDPIAAHLKKSINARTDVVLILKSDYKSGCVVGTVENDDIFVLIPFVKKA